MPDRETWIANLPRMNEREEDALAPVFDERWGEIENTHRTWVDRFLSLLPPEGRVLDAACGTGKYFGMVLATGRSILGVDHAGAYLSVARVKFPRVPTQKHDLQNIPYREEFDGVMCVDAMEMIPPEDWPIVLGRFRRALHPGGWLYLSLELAAEDTVRTLNEDARRRGLPVVDREVVWKEFGYHHYPRLERVQRWLEDGRFVIEDQAEGPWDDGYAYHHLLARAHASGGSRTFDAHGLR